MKEISGLKVWDECKSGTVGRRVALICQPVVGGNPCPYSECCKWGSQDMCSCENIGRIQVEIGKRITYSLLA